METEVLLKKAKLDVWCAINLAVAIKFGYVKVNPEQLLENYCILRSWQEKLGDKAPAPLKTLIDEFESLCSEFKDVLLDCYNSYKNQKPLNPSSPKNSSHTDEEKQKKDFYSVLIFFPPNNGVVS